MKKVLSLFLAITMVLSLFSGLAISANAETGVSFSFDKESYEIGESVWLTITGTDLDSNSWVGLYAPGEATDGSVTSIAWQYMSSINGTAVDYRNDAAGALDWSNGRSEWYGFPAGTYTVAVYADGGYTVLDSTTFTINAPAVTPTVSFSFDKESYEIGDAVALTIEAANVPSGSWLGIYAPGGGSSSYGWEYMEGTVNKTISLVPGNSELANWNQTAPFYAGTWSVALYDAANQVIGSASSFTFNAPAGQPEPSYQLSLSKDGENPTYYICQNEDPTFTINAENYNDTDWIAIHCADETPGGSLPSIKYAYIKDINGQAINIREDTSVWYDSPTRIGHKELPATDYTIYVCLNDGYAVATSISFKVRDHKSETLPAVEPTCEENGLTKGSKCELCETVLTAQQEVSALGHNWGEWTITTPASCTTAGEKQRVCTRDANHIEKQTIEATGHTEAEPVVENNVEPTCENAGSYDSVVYCSDCKAELSRNNVTVEALGHNWGEWTITTPASCTTAGEKQRVCTRDANHIETQTIEATGHTYVPVVTAPTCTEQGYTTYTCSDCQDSYIDNYVEAKGHTEAEPVVENNVEPTCENAGSYDSVVYCSDCKAELSRNNVTVEALGHSWGEWTVNTAATCTTAGEKQRVCTRDASHVEKDTIPMTEHKPVVSEKGFAPTCKDPGMTDEIICSECQEVLQMATPIKPLGHSWGEWKVTKEATCGEAGEETRICENNKNHKETRATEPTGEHNLGLVVTSTATTERTGTVESKCLVCGAREGSYETPIIVPKIGEATLSKTSYYYDKTAKEPAVVVKDEEGNEISSQYYSVKYENNNKVGTAKAVITFSDRYEGTITLDFSIVALAKPTLKVSKVSQTAVALKWTKVAGAKFYRVYAYNTKTGKYTTVVKSTTSTSCTIKKLAAGSTYYYLVRAFVNDDVGSDYSKADNVKAITLCKAPALKAAVKGKKVTLKWSKVTGAKFYRVYKYNAKTKKYSTLLKSTTKLTASFKSQPKGKNYYLVRAFNANSEGSAYTTKNLVKATVK